jgi:UDP-glucose 4-epimerase
MRVLVTGAAGFIGSHVMDRLRAAGHEPVGFDVRPSPHHARGEAAMVVGDLLDPDALTKAMQGCDAVAHLAAAADVDQVAKNPAAAEELNSRGTLSVLEAARAAEVPRIVYASTIWVYDGHARDLVDEETPVSQSSHLYTATKLAGEMYCRSYAELYDVEFTILRFGIPYGPRARPAAVIPAFVNKALAGEPLTIAGDGAQARRFVYVEDLADGVVCGLRPSAANRTYNLAGEEDVTIAQIAAAVKEQFEGVEIVHTSARPGDFSGAPVSSERAARELGWRAATPFSEGMANYVDWHVHEREAAARKAAAAASPPARVGRAARTGFGLLPGIVAMFAVCLVAVHLLRADGDAPRAVGVSLLLALAFLLGAGLDWDAGRQRALVLSGLALTAFGLALVVPWPHDVLVLMRDHILLAIVAVVALVGLGFAVAGRRRAEAPSSTR